jgi:hypothetical protein
VADFQSTSVTMTVNGRPYSGNPITVDHADGVFTDANRAAPAKLNRALVAATFGLTNDEVGSLPWAAYKIMLDHTLDLNGLRPQGEAPATASSTSA